MVCMVEPGDLHLPLLHSGSIDEPLSLLLLLLLHYVSVGLSPTWGRGLQEHL